MRLIPRVGDLDMPELNVAPASVEPNCEVIRREYCESRTLARLHTLYGGLSAGERRNLSAEKIRDAFIDPRGWTLLRV